MYTDVLFNVLLYSVHMCVCQVMLQYNSMHTDTLFSVLRYTGSFIHNRCYMLREAVCSIQ